MHTEHELPQRFCWTRFGAEAGEPVAAIFLRKERERTNNGGVFLWGIGSSVAPGMRALVALERQPRVVFSPMRSPARREDTHPTSVVVWTQAITMDGAEWAIPAACTVTSRGKSSQAPKRRHFALVCKSDTPLGATDAPNPRIDVNALRNLGRGSSVGASQVTAVVELVDVVAEPQYDVTFVAELVYPYFIELREPVEVTGSSLSVARARAGRGGQLPLIAARR
jgi:hypothetical protein